MLYLHPLEIPPANLEEIGQAIGSSSHIAEFVEKNGRPGHAPADVMEEKVLMDLVSGC